MSPETLREVADSDIAKIAALYAGGLLALFGLNAVAQKFIEGIPRRRRVREAKRLEK